MAYLSTNEIATKFAESHNIPAGETRNIKLTHKQSAWLQRQAHYDKQMENNNIFGSVLDADKNVIGVFYCSDKYMLNNVWVMEVRMYRTKEQVQAANEQILSNIAQYESMKEAFTDPLMIENIDLAINSLRQQLTTVA